MECKHCGGLVIWKGPLTDLTHLECQQCGAIDGEIIDEEPEQVLCSGGCDRFGEVNYNDDEFYCGSTSRCCP